MRCILVRERDNMRLCPKYCGLKTTVLVSKQCEILALEIDERSVDLVRKLTLNYNLTILEFLSKRNNSIVHKLTLNYDLSITNFLSNKNLIWSDLIKTITKRNSTSISSSYRQHYSRLSIRLKQLHYISLRRCLCFFIAMRAHFVILSRWAIIKSNKRLFQAFAIIIIIEDMSSKQENIKLASNHQKADDFQISMKTSQQLIVELTFELIVELTSELISELSTELILELIFELISELNTELITASNHEMNSETVELYETAANDDHSSSFITIVLKLREYVERKHSTVDENRLIMSHASTWWRWSRDAALRCKSYLRNDSMTNRTRDSILHLMISFESRSLYRSSFRSSSEIWAYSTNTKTRWLNRRSRSSVTKMRSDHETRRWALIDDDHSE